MITLIGHGYIGTHIAKRLRNFEWISHKDVPNKHTKFIINATGYIGYPNVESCETNRQVCMEANVLYPLSLEYQYDVPILHITSGCVYQGYPENGWKETDEPNLNFDTGPFYSACKSLFQTLMKPYLNKSYVFRIRIPFDDLPNRKNLLYKLENYDTIVNYENSITCIDDLIECILLFSRRFPPFGIYNIVNKGIISNKEIAEKMELSNKTFVAPKEFERNCTVVRSSCSLNTEKIETIYPMPSIHDALNNTIVHYRKNRL